KVEEPHKRRDIPQCLNCQSYGHTRAYCSFPPRCVKCGEGHPTSVCEKTPDTPATCALCSGSHPANYKGCTVHKELQNRRRHPLTSTKLTQKPHLNQPLQCPAPSTSSPSSNLQSNTRPSSYVNVTEKRIDIVLISETHFTSNSYVNLPGYDSYRANHPDNTAHAGAAIYIKSSLKYIPLPNFISDDIQSYAISLILNNIPITFAAVYSPPKHKISPARFTEIFSTVNNNYIIGGDLNAKHQQWGCRALNPRGNSLLQSLLTTNSTVIAPPNYTYWPNSHHSPVMLSLDCLPQAKVNPSALSQFPIDWNKFSTILSEKTCLKLCLKTPSDIDDAVNLLTTNIQTSVWDSAKPVPLHVKPPPHLPSYIRTLISQKRRARVFGKELDTLLTNPITTHLPKS
ncbi:Reverse transcriptase domain-containing protein, partial [Aphis craccivora]